MTELRQPYRNLVGRVLDPDEFCANCGASYGFADESCERCQFDPVGDEDDAKLDETVRTEFQKQENEK